MKNFFKGKKILITGHTGFKGAWLSQILLEFGADVVGVSLPVATSPSLFGVLGLEKRTRTHYQDIRDFNSLKKIFEKEKPEIVFHLAAQALVRDSYDDPLATFSSNVMGTANVLQAIKEVGGVKAAVIITTDKVYANNELPNPYRETDPLGGYDPYSSSKAAADIVTSSYIKSFFNIKDFGGKHNTLVAIARAGNVIGGGDWANDRLVPDMVRAIYDRKEEVVLRSPKAVRPWQHVLDPLRGYLMLAQELHEKNIAIVGAWNFGPSPEESITVEELVKEAIKILETGSYRVENDIAKHEAGLLTLDINKAKSELKWEPLVTFAQSIKMTFDWYREYHEQRDQIVEFTDKQIRDYFK
jgi:CDP-glucose 4,6-dehydratase